MFFKRRGPEKLTFDDYLRRLRDTGFQTAQVGGKWKVWREGVGVVIENAGNGAHPKVTERAGVMIGDEIAALVDGGFQKFFQTPGGVRRPAVAAELKRIHEFQEDLREALGLTSLYNESLGTVSDLYLYDRVKDRDLARPKRPWEVKVRGAEREEHR